jgi:hypothetical protein
MNKQTYFMTKAGVLLLVAVVLCVFALQKEGYHMDEMISFEMANAAFNPWVVPTQPEGRLAKYVRENLQGKNLWQSTAFLTRTLEDVMTRGRDSELLRFQGDVYPEPIWINRNTFHDYLTVGKDDFFLYPSVYFNVKDDNHPPFHFMLLHTVSSLLPGQIFPFMGCVINIAAILGCCLLWMALGRVIDGNDYGFYTKVGLLGALFYGVSVGGIQTMLLIRMYAVLSFLCVLTGYLYVKKWKDTSYDPHGRRIIAVAVLGFWTQYFYLFYCFTLAFITVVILWRKRRTALKRYLGQMILAAVIGIAGFPFAIADVFSSGRGVEVMDKISGGLAGYGERLAAFVQILLSACFGDIWKKITEGSIYWMIGGAGILILLCLGICFAYQNQKKSNPKDRSILWMLSIPPLVMFLLAAKVSPYLVDRYIMAVYPFAMWGIAVGIVKLSGLWSKYRKEWKIVLGVGIAFCIGWNLVHYDGTYLYKGYRAQLETAKEYRELPCICVYEGYGFYENLEEFQEYSTTLLVKPGELEQRLDRTSLQALDQVVVLEKGNVDGELVRSILEEQYGLYPVRELTDGSAHGDRVWLWEKRG